MSGTFGARLVSDWADAFGSRYDFSHHGRPIRLVGINTSTLSCANDDNKKLVVDLGALNSFLEHRQDDSECVIAIGHHPLDWLVSWNQAEVERLLRQETGAHLYLHGHQHNQLSVSQSTSMGESLAVLECGASYQGSRWPQYFSMYQVRFSNGEIDTAVFALSPSSGLWVRNNERSLPISARLPSGKTARGSRSIENNRQREPSGTVLGPRVPSVSHTRADLGLVSRPKAPPIHDNIELDARRRLDEAKPIFDVVNRILSPSFLKSLPLYRDEGRLKKLDGILWKG